MKKLNTRARMQELILQRLAKGPATTEQLYEFVEPELTLEIRMRTIGGGNSKYRKEPWFHNVVRQIVRDLKYRKLEANVAWGQYELTASAARH